MYRHRGMFFILRMCFILVLNVIFIEASADTFSIEVSPGQTTGQMGSSVTLPCWISPPQTTEELEIRWYRPDHYDTPVLLYRDGKIQENQEEQYRNRSFLTQRSARSDGLKDGDVSLRLDNLTIQDKGVFYCYVSGVKSYDSRAVTLSITALGSTPVLFPQPVDDTHTNVSCRSGGWFPQPNITWMSDSRRVLSAGGVSHRREAEGTFSVHSWTLVSLSDTQQIFCLLSLSGGDKWEGGLDVQAYVSSSGPWKTLFIISVVSALVGLSGFIMYKHREKLTGKKTDEQSVKSTGNPRMLWECTDPCLVSAPLAVCIDVCIKNLRKNAVAITLDRSSGHPALKISNDLKFVRDSEDYQQKKVDEFPYELCVCGFQTFNFGRHYWEVELVQNNVDPKSYWLIGVMKAGNDCTADTVSLTPSNGFWFLCSDGPNGFYVNTESPASLLFSPRPEHVGVLLDYDKGQLTFYDAKECKHLLTMSTKFSGSLVPLFNPGVGDVSPLKIVDLSEPEESPAESCQPLVPV